ncbi:unnamed protein product [Moneuplotes crassus]|uniref:MORN repeat protein n=1 Tax=Euplotes crassus TaxID=5936 RepID=A0AAD1X9L1_EUPCR|nr:unnamed protein product [Moneuplotes crassus]
MEQPIAQSLDQKVKSHPEIDEGNDGPSNREENKMDDLSEDQNINLVSPEEIKTKLKIISICTEEFIEFSKKTHKGKIPRDHFALYKETRARAGKIQSDLEKDPQDQDNLELSRSLLEADRILASLKNNKFYKDFEADKVLKDEKFNKRIHNKDTTLDTIKEDEEKAKSEEEHQLEVALLKSQLKQEQDKYKDLKEAYDKLCNEQNQTSEDLQGQEKDTPAPKEETKEDTANEDIKEEIINSLVKEQELEEPGENDQQQDCRLDAFSQDAMESNQNLDKDQDHSQSESKAEVQQESSATKAPASGDTSALEKTQMEEDKNPEAPEEEKASLEEEKKTEEDSEEVYLVYIEITFPNGDSYKGQVNAHTGEQHGQGTYLWKSGDKYIGQWKNGKPEGQGIMYYDDGDMYEGEWVNGKFHGTGLYKWKDGATYQGECANNSMNGQGVYKEPDGYSYEGEWEDDKRHGQGVACYSSGAKYVGQFQNDLKHGEGVLTFKDGRIHQGHWENDKPNGYGVFIDPNTGERCEGQWKEGKKHGEFTVILKDGERVTEYYDNNKKV